jgi:hypothetical protein
MGGQIISRVPFEDYREVDAVNISRLKEIEHSPQRYMWRATHQIETKPLTLGKAAHCAVLEPERFNQDFVIWTKLTKNGSGNIAPRSGEQWENFKAENVGKSILTIEERDFAMAIQKAVRADATAMRYLEAGDPEVSMEWTMGAEWGLEPRRCKGRVDWITKVGGIPFLVGLKTARDCRPFIFGSAAAKLGYAMQWAFYHQGYSIITGVEPKMIEIVVEPKPPHSIIVYRIEKDVLLEGTDKFAELLKVLAECEVSGNWPGPAVDEQVLTLPSWYYQVHDDVSDLGLLA